MTPKPFVIALIAASCLTTAGLAGDLTRVATVPLGSEVTGMFVHGRDLFFNVQHPDAGLPTEFSRASVGVVPNIDLAGAPLAAPTRDRDKHVVRTSMGSYQILVQEGDFGVIGHIPVRPGKTRVSNDPDFNAFVPVSDASGYLFTNWENRPGGMSRIKLSRARDGTWSVDAAEARMLDFSRVGGTWANCFGTLSPWGTPLSSEELYFDDTAGWNDPARQDAGVSNLAAYLGAFPNPYRYGYIVEITDPAGTAIPVKAFAMGRFSHENAVIMPDRRTAYLSDDGTDAVFFKFIADRAGDLGAGTLYAAKIVQQGKPGADAGTTGLRVSWIELAHGTQAQIEMWIAEYDGIDRSDRVAGETSYIGDAEIAAWARGEAADDRAAFLESRKAARARGATAEFRKMEGVNINHDAVANGTAPFLYLAISEVAKGMSDGKGDLQLSKNRCGVVYEMRLDAGFDVSMMTPVVAGGPYDKTDKANACSPGNIANPDNLVVLDDGRVLIGEDSNLHENNAIWLFTPDRHAR